MNSQEGKSLWAKIYLKKNLLRQPQVMNRLVALRLRFPKHLLLCLAHLRLFLSQECEKGYTAGCSYLWQVCWYWPP